MFIYLRMFAGTTQMCYDRQRFLRKGGLSTFCQVVESRHALNAGAVVSLDEESYQVSLTSFKGFSAENPLDEFKSEEKHLSGLAWWIMSDESCVGYIQADVKSIYEGTSTVKVPLQVRSNFGILQGVDFSDRDIVDVETYFEKKMRAINGSNYAVPLIREEGGKDLLLTSTFTFGPKKTSAAAGGGKEFKITSTLSNYDITPQTYPDKMHLFNRIFGPLQGLHDLSSGKKIDLIPLEGGRQFERFGHFFGKNPPEAAENFLKALQVRSNFFENELMLILGMPSLRTESEISVGNSGVGGL
ncbi:MAG: hypothetical protein B7Y25_03765 [Alphaproteobacteria bacterium 16-39-46]|nr:MAG: hypothetical protein B7Y25_03765 [Alphaproteobacteria bacterium 16-39-46]OZA43169.1 MAG: hypothetical protein B7X84_03990 [Alphaproteobacteria bacterium 17-39-52]